MDSLMLPCMGQLLVSHMDVLIHFMVDMLMDSLNIHQLKGNKHITI